MNRNLYTMRKEQAKKEFEFIINNYILPFFDAKGEMIFHNTLENNKQLIGFIKEVDGIQISFYPCVSQEGKPSPFHFSIKVHSGEELVKRARIILHEILKVTEYNCLDFSKRRDYGKQNNRSIYYKKRALDLAFELGMCKWLTQTEDDAFTLHTLISELINWSSKTYEGKRTSFGFVVDFDLVSHSSAADYLNFLENNNSAVFTDGVFSGILLDKMGKVLSFISKSNEPIDYNDKKEVFAPFRFFEIARYCFDSRIGVLVLTNGEIIIIKNKAICFSKQGSKWVSYDWSRVYEKLRPYFLTAQMAEMDSMLKIKELYCTLLDVSFSHSGGCLALVLPSEEENLSTIIKERMDLYVKGLLPKEVSTESIEKISVLTSLLCQPTGKTQSFFEISKPLRKEILDLDGATVISFNGNFFCAGSIVSVPGGSSGGGRTAAAKNLAKHGVGIKISEDGYIEAYGKNLSSFSPEIITLFSFK